MVTIPFSKSVSTVNVTVSQGSFSFDELTKVLSKLQLWLFLLLTCLPQVAVWKVGRITPTQNAAEMNGTLTLVPGSHMPENPTVQLDFLLEGVAVSGLSIQVRRLCPFEYPFRFYSHYFATLHAGVQHFE